MISKLKSLWLPALALATSVWMMLPAARQADAFALAGGNLPLNQRQYSVFNNFTAPTANNNGVRSPNFPGTQGAVMAIWKGAAEWGSLPHGDGQGDPTQPIIGSGRSNFDSSFQSKVGAVGDVNGNIQSEISGSQPGVYAFCETPISDGWRIRYYADHTWSDGPGPTNAGEVDIQAVACHVYGHALGLDHSTLPGATMAATYGAVVSARSIHADDVAGLAAIYGSGDSFKPRITGLSIYNNRITITGANFSVTGNEIWFTQKAFGSGTPIKVTNVSSNETSIAATVPSLAGPGDVLVRRNGTDHWDLSNAWPTDLTEDTSICSVPVSYCQVMSNSGSGGARMISMNDASVSSGNFLIGAWRLPPNKVGLFFYGAGQTNLTFGDGRLCVDGTLYRLPIQVTNSTGEVRHILDFSAPPLGSGPGRIVAGDTLNFQFWFRDPGFGPAGFNTSDGLSIKFCD